MMKIYLNSLYFTVLLSLFFNLRIYPQQIDSVTYYFQNYDYEKAIEIINKIDNYESNIQFVKTKAAALKALNQFPEAILLYNKILQSDSSDLKSVIDLANCYQSLGDYNNAQLLYKKALQKNPNNTWLIQQLANSYFQVSDYQNALLNYSIACSMDSSYYNLKQIAECYYYLENYDTAVIYYCKALDLFPSDFQCTYKLADIYKQKGQYMAGISLTNSFLAQDSLNIKILKINGLLNFLHKDYTLSAKRFEQCLFLNDSTYFTEKYLGFSYFKQKLYDNAKEYLERAFIRDTSNIDLCYALGLSCCYSAYKKLGIGYLNKTVNLVSPSITLLSQVYQDLGIANTEFYKYDDGLTAYLKAYELNPNDTLLIFRIASHYDNWIKDKNKALEYYQIFMETRPREKKPLPQTDEVIFISYYDFVERRISELKEEQFWESEKK